MADLINGLAFLINGVYKTVQLNTLTSIPEFVMRDCALMPWPALRLFGAQWPAILTFYLGLERLMAVRLPFLHVSFTDRVVLLLSLVSVVLVAAPNSVLWIAEAVKNYPPAVGYIYCCFCVRSSLNIFIFGICNTDFRSQLHDLLQYILFKIMHRVRQMISEFCKNAITMKNDENMHHRQAKIRGERGREVGKYVFAQSDPAGWGVV
uniref:G-protein coupled receptors family 1 profile domain-containing protein n=1 Tax=Ascaris lumbricoides TaxID=6252 RepID=A0A9J2PV15_ASCLU